MLKRIQTFKQLSECCETMCRVTESHKMQEDTLREKQAVQLRLQGALDMQTALEKSYEAKVRCPAEKLP